MTDPIPLVAQIAEVRREIEFRTREHAGKGCQRTAIKALKEVSVRP